MPKFTRINEESAKYLKGRLQQPLVNLAGEHGLCLKDLEVVPRKKELFVVLAFELEDEDTEMEVLEKYGLLAVIDHDLEKYRLLTVIDHDPRFKGISSLKLLSPFKDGDLILSLKGFEPKNRVRPIVCVSSIGTVHRLTLKQFFNGIGVGTGGKK